MEVKKYDIHLQMTCTYVINMIVVNKNHWPYKVVVVGRLTVPHLEEVGQHHMILQPATLRAISFIWRKKGTFGICRDLQQ